MIWLDDKTGSSAEKAVEHAGHAAEAAGHAASGAGSMLEKMKHYFDTGHLFEHVQDANFFEVPRFLGGHWSLPKIGVGVARCGAPGVGFWLAGKKGGNRCKADRAAVEFARVICSVYP